MGNAHSQMDDDPSGTIQSVADMLFYDMEGTSGTSNDSRKRKRSSSPKSGGTSPVTRANLKLPDATDKGDSDLPPRKKPKTELPTIHEESEIDLEPKFLDPRVYASKSPTLPVGQTHSDWIGHPQVDLNSPTTNEILSTYSKPLSITSIQLEQLVTQKKTKKPSEMDWRAVLRSSNVIALINEGVNEILGVLKVGIADEPTTKKIPTPAGSGDAEGGLYNDGTAFEETSTENLEKEQTSNFGIDVETDHQERKVTAEMGVGTDTNQDIDRASGLELVRLLEGRITILHNEKEDLRKAVLHSTEELDKAKAYVKSLHTKYAEDKQEYEAQMTRSFNNKWNEHAKVLNSHKKKIMENARLNQQNRDFLLQVKARLKSEMQEIRKERILLKGEIQRYEMESNRLEEERKENEKVQEKLRIKERNECWMWTKLKSQENTLEAFKAEKEQWRKDWEVTGIKMRKLIAELAQARGKAPMLDLGHDEDPKVDEEGG